MGLRQAVNRQQAEINNLRLKLKDVTGQLSSRNERLAQLQNTLTDRKQTIVELRRKLDQATQAGPGPAKVAPTPVIEPRSVASEELPDAAPADETLVDATPVDEMQASEAPIPVIEAQASEATASTAPGDEAQANMAPVDETPTSTTARQTMKRQ